MTRFTAIALVVSLLAVPARADDTCTIPTIYPEYGSNFECISLRCQGLRMIREAYKRGEIQSVHLFRLTECQELREFDLATGEQVAVPCTYDRNDIDRPPRGGPRVKLVHGGPLRHG